MRIAGHDQAKSLAFHRLAVVLIGDDHLFAGETGSISPIASATP